MTPRDRHDLPEFVRDALAEPAPASGDIADALALLGAGLAPEPAHDARLLAAVARLPLRYAPFYERLGALWDLSEADVERVLARAAEPSAWTKPGFPGVRLLEVLAGPRLSGARVALVRFRAGLTFPKHRHEGREAQLVLEGSYRDQSGRVVGPGELHEMPPGSEHSFRVGRGEPCIAASIQYGMQFTGPVMRVLAKIFG
ncbi:MAG TPA: cupin domain-containing protein [Polyangiaceae bacterium]|jgi:putative transcriptional regulator|nr:cupin domain-containing protein [Polyangiaceae bacterium]